MSLNLEIDAREAATSLSHIGYGRWAGVSLVAVAVSIPW